MFGAPTSLGESARKCMQARPRARRGAVVVRGRRRAHRRAARLELVMSAARSSLYGIISVAPKPRRHALQAGGHRSAGMARLRV